MKNIEQYRKRDVQFIQHLHVGDWKLKVYGITADSQPVPTEIITQAIETIPSFLPLPAKTDDRYGVGFLIIHIGTLRNWFLLDWWEYEDILCHKLFSSPLKDFEQITPETESSVMACVHELRVINFESETWINTVLSETNTNGIENYINEIYNR